MSSRALVVYTTAKQVISLREEQLGNAFCGHLFSHREKLPQNTADMTQHAVSMVTWEEETFSKHNEILAKPHTLVDSIYQDYPQIEQVPSLKKDFINGAKTNRMLTTNGK